VKFVVEPDDATHEHTATSPTITRRYTIDVDDTFHAVTSDEPTLVTNTARNITIAAAAIAPPRHAATITASSRGAATVASRYAATTTDGTRTAAVEPARHTARIEDT
jgi:hypothetical protein